MGDIVFFATPYTTAALDPFVVQELLDMHTSVFPTARHPSARDLLRGRGYGEYLRALGRELERAVRHGLLRVEKFTTPFPFIEMAKEKPPSQPPPLGPDEEEENFFVRVLNEEGSPMAGAIVRVTGSGVSGAERTADSSGWVEIVVPSVPSSCTVEWRASSDKEFKYERKVSLLLGDDDDSHHRRLGHLGYDAESLDERVAHYKADFGHDDAATLADIRGELSGWHGGGQRPQVRESKGEA